MRGIGKENEGVDKGEKEWAGDKDIIMGRQGKDKDRRWEGERRQEGG